MRRGDANERIRRAVVEQPAAVEMREALNEDGARGVLAGLFIVSFRLQERLIGSLQELCRIFGVKERLACRVGIGGQIGIAAFARVLSVIEQQNAVGRDDRGRSGFGKGAVELPWTRGDRVNVGNGLPMDQVR